jgi:alanine dehydrogenase
LREQASHGGEINVALSKYIITKKNIYAEIGEIIIGKKSGRDFPDQITVFDSTGLAIQDISAAGQIYQRLMSDSQYADKLQHISLL